MQRRMQDGQVREQGSSMKYAKRFWVTWFVAMCLLVAVTVTYAADMQVQIEMEWQNATLNTDGTPYADPSHSMFYFGSEPGQDDLGVMRIDDPEASKLIFNAPVPSGTTVYARGYHVDLVGNTSVASLEVAFGPFVSVDNLAPAPPTNLGGNATVVGCPQGYECTP